MADFCHFFSLLQGGQVGVDPLTADWEANAPSCLPTV